MSWSSQTNHQCPGSFSRHTRLLPPTHTHTHFTEVKSSFFISQLNSRPRLFHFIRRGWRPSAAVKVEAVSERDNKREGDILGFFVEWEEILKHCAMVPQKFWKVESVLPAKRLRVGPLEKRSPCCIHTEWRAISSHLWVWFLLFIGLSKLSGDFSHLRLKATPVGVFFLKGRQNTFDIQEDRQYSFFSTWLLWVYFTLNTGYKVWAFLYWDHRENETQAFGRVSQRQWQENRSL